MAICIGPTLYDCHTSQIMANVQDLPDLTLIVTCNISTTVDRAHTASR